MGRFLIAMVVGGGVLAFLGVQELRLASEAKPEPQTLTCEALGQNGPGDNAHIIMSDFLLSPGGFVYEGDKAGTTYKTVWIPAVPLEGEYHRELKALLDSEGNLPDNIPAPRDLRVILRSKNLKNDAAIGTLGDADTVQGLVINKISKLSGKELKLLQESYPGIDFAKVWILEHGRQPAGVGKTVGLVGGGVALILIAAALFIRGRQKASDQAIPPAAPGAA